MVFFTIFLRATVSRFYYSEVEEYSCFTDLMSYNAYADYHLNVKQGYCYFRNIFQFDQSLQHKINIYIHKIQKG